MDYENNYKDAFSLAKDWYNDATTSEKERRLLAAMFSELKESKHERMSKNCIHFLKLQKAHHADTSEIDDCIAYLEHLQEYIDDIRQYAYNKGLVDAKEKQQPAEWSKEEETNGWTGADLGRYLSCLQRLSTGNPQQPETINSKWFKEHCRPQSHWKPSEEQIDSLEAVVGMIYPMDARYDAVFGLLEELKALKP